jgi:hypothetical protein
MRAHAGLWVLSVLLPLFAGCLAEGGGDAEEDPTSAAHAQVSPPKAPPSRTPLQIVRDQTPDACYVDVRHPACLRDLQPKPTKLCFHANATAGAPVTQSPCSVGGIDPRQRFELVNLHPEYDVYVYWIRLVDTNLCVTVPEDPEGTIEQKLTLRTCLQPSEGQVDCHAAPARGQCFELFVLQNAFQPSNPDGTPNFLPSFQLSSSAPVDGFDFTGRVDVPNGSTAPGTQLQIYRSISGATNQHWLFEYETVVY